MSLLAEPVAPTGEQVPGSPEPASTQPETTPDPALPSDPVVLGDSPLKFADLMGEDGAFKADAPWEKVLTPLQVEKHAATFRKYKTPEELLRGVGHMAAMVGVSGDKVTVPTEDAPAAVVAEFRRALGIPETPDGYGIKKPEDLPEGLEWNDEHIKALTDVLHKGNATPGLAQDLLALHTQIQAEAVKQAELEAANEATRAREQGLAELKEAWGNNLPEELSKAKRMAIKEGIAEDDPALSSPVTIKLLAKLAKMTGEDKLPIDAADQVVSSKAEAHRIMTDAGHPDHLRYHSGTDKALMLRVQNMLQGRG